MEVEVLMYEINLLESESDMNRCLNSLCELIDKAYGDSSGETTIRKFILHIYNSSNPAVGFNSLDHDNFKKCIDVLFLSHFIECEIHRCIVNGKEIFEELWQIENRE